jgi:hypothetical protein
MSSKTVARWGPELSSYAWRIKTTEDAEGFQANVHVLQK